MKFCKKYEEYMQGQSQKKKLPGVGFKKLKKILKRCRREIPSRNLLLDHHPPAQVEVLPRDKSTCPHHCPGIYIHKFSTTGFFFSLVQFDFRFAFNLSVLKL